MKPTRSDLAALAAAAADSLDAAPWMTRARYRLAHRSARLERALLGDRAGPWLTYAPLGARGDGAMLWVGSDGSVRASAGPRGMVPLGHTRPTVRQHRLAHLLSLAAWRRAGGNRCVPVHLSFDDDFDRDHMLANFHGTDR